MKNKLKKCSACRCQKLRKEDFNSRGSEICIDCLEIRNRHKIIIDGKKICPECDKWLLLKFFKIRKSNDYITKKCKACCHKKYKSSERYQSDKEKYRLYRKNNKEILSIKTLLRQAKARALGNNLPFNLTLEDIFVPEYCPVLGIKLERGNNKCGESSPSLDKIIPSLGYVKGNICIISMKANRLKNNASLSELEKIIGYMKQYISNMSSNDYQI